MPRPPPRRSTDRLTPAEALKAAFDGSREGVEKLREFGVQEDPPGTPGLATIFPLAGEPVQVSHEAANRVQAALGPSDAWTARVREDGALVVVTWPDGRKLRIQP